MASLVSVHSAFSGTDFSLSKSSSKLLAPSFSGKFCISSGLSDRIFEISEMDDSSGKDVPSVSGDVIGSDVIRSSTFSSVFGGLTVHSEILR